MKLTSTRQELPRHASVIVLGAGLTGLQTALELQNEGITPLVLEKETEAGGLARTRIEQGFRFDATGHLLHVASEARRAQIFSLLDEEPLRLDRQSRIFSHGVYTRYPFQSNLHGLPQEVIYRCLLDYLQARERQDSTLPHNFEEFCRRHFGDGISEHFMLPYNARLWGVSPSEITTEWCERFVPLPQLEDVIAGTLGLPGRELGYNAEFYYPRLGIGELPKAMARRVKDLHVGVELHRIDPIYHRISMAGATLTYGVLVNTAPLPSLLNLIEGLPESLQPVGAKLRASKLYYLDIALRKPPNIQLHWAYVPEPRFPFYRVGVYSAFSTGMAPVGQANLYVELESRTPPHLPTLMPQVIEGLITMQLLRSSEDVLFVKPRCIDPAYVLYDAQRRGALDALFPWLRSQDILSTGRYGGWNYSSMQDALEFGEEAARTCREHLTARS